MPRYTEDIQLGGYVPVAVTPKFKATSRLAEAMKTLDTRHEQALQQLSAIDLALSQVELNEAEDAWKANYIADIKKQIDDAAMYGSYATALPTAIKLVGQVRNDPALRARERYQAHYKEFIDRINNNKTLDQDTKDWAIAKNPYNYKDRVDSNGRVIGGTDWVPNKTPVDTVPLNLILSTALQWAKADSGGGTTATAFVNSKGEIMSEELGNLDMSDIVDVAYQKNNTWTRLGKDKLMEAVNAAIESTPGAKASLDQEFTVAKWKYSQLTDEEKMGLQGSAVTDRNGKPLDFNQFLAKKINPFINAAQYSSNVTKVDYGTGFKTAFELKQQAKAAAQEAMESSLGQFRSNVTGMGYNITYDTTDFLNKAEADISDAIEAIERVSPTITNTKRWQEAKAKGDYDTLERIFNTPIVINGQRIPYIQTIKDRNIANTLEDAFKIITDNKGWIQDTYGMASKAQIDALKFKNAWDSGQPLPEGTLSKSFYNTLDRMLGGKYQDVNNFKISFGDADDVDQFFGQLGVSKQNAKELGVTLGNEDGRLTATFNRDNDNLPKFIQAFNNLSMHVGGNLVTGFSLGIIGDLKHNDFEAIDDEGNSIHRFRRGEEYIPMNYSSGAQYGPYTLSSLNSLYNQASRTVNNFKNTTGKLSQTNQTVNSDLPGIAEAREKYGAESPEFAAISKDIMHSTLARIVGGNTAQMTIYGVNEDTGNLQMLDTKDRLAILGQLSYAAGKGDTYINVQFTGDGFIDGYQVTIPGKITDKGTLVPSDTPTVYVISTGIEDEALNKHRTDTKTRALKEYNRRRSSYGSYRTLLGNTISNISNTGADINNIPVKDPITVRNYIESDIIIQDLISAINDGTRFIPGSIPKVISDITKLLGDSSPAVIQQIIQTVDNRIADNRKEEFYRQLMTE